MTYLILFLLVLFASLYVFRNKLVSLMSFAITAMMVISGIAVLCGLFIPQLFTAWAENTLENSGTLTSIQKIDGSLSLDGVATAADSLWSKITGIFGAPTPTPTSTSGQNTAKPAGILEANLYPSLVSGLAETYKTLTIIVGLVVMGLSVYFAYATAGVAEVATLTQRVAELEAKISQNTH